MTRMCECPGCFFEFEVEDDAMVGEIISCPDCGAELEIVSIDGDKVKCETAETAEEDWGE